VQASASVKDLIDRLPDAVLMVCKDTENRSSEQMIPGEKYKSPTLKLNYCNKQTNALFNPNLGLLNPMDHKASEYLILSKRCMHSMKDSNIVGHAKEMVN
jgi:hypothetical protein